jgi:hypothetical protein
MCTPTVRRSVSVTPELSRIRMTKMEGGKHKQIQEPIVSLGEYFDEPLDRLRQIHSAECTPLVVPRLPPFPACGF